MADAELKTMAQILEDRGVNVLPPTTTFASVATAHQDDFVIPEQYFATDEGQAALRRAEERQAQRRTFNELRDFEERLERTHTAIRDSGQLMLF